MKTILNFCYKYLLKYKFLIFIYLILCSFISFSSIIITYILGNFVDYLIIGNSIQIVVKYCIYYFIFSFGKLVLSYLINRLHTYLQTKIGFELNRDIILHIQNLPLSYIEQNNTASLNQRINYDSNALISFCIDFFQNILVHTLTIIFSLLLIYSFNTTIAITLSVFIPIYICLYYFLKKNIYSSSFDLKEKQAIYFGELYTQLSHIKRLKLNAMCVDYICRLNAPFKQMLESIFKYQKICYIFSGSVDIILAIANIFLFILGGQQVLEGKLSIGHFSIILSYFSGILNSTRFLFTLGKTIQDTMVSYKRLHDICSMPQSSRGDIIIDNLFEISLVNYSKWFGKTCVIDSFSAKFTKGNIYTIVGANGSGKSTLLNAILGLYVDESHGNLFYNEIPIESINMENVYKNLIGVVEQEPLLFNDTIEFNITLGDSSKIDRLQDLVNILSLSNYLSKLPNGLQTFINENADNISGGEKQKICLLNILLKDPEVIVLDEPTSALDSNSIKNLKDYLLSIKKDKIIIIVTHDNHFVDISDKIITLSI